MTTTLLRITTSSAALAVALSAQGLVLAPSASASPPSTTTATFEVDRPYHDCGDYVINGAWTVSFRESTHNRPDGAEVLTIHLRYAGRLYNSSDATKWVDDRGNPTIRIEDGTMTATGPGRHVTVKGLGVVLLDTGRLSIGPDGVTYSGPHDELEGSWDELCDALR